MSFVYPAFLWSLFAVSIPIIIHLFNFRTYKTVYFSNLAFLSSVHRERKSRSRLKHLLILLARILALTSLILAFAQPFIPRSGQTAAKADEQQYVSIYVDNSFSMNAENEKGNLLGQAKSNAAEIAESYSQNTRFYLITNNFNPARQHWASREQFLEMLNRVKVSPVSRNLSEIADRQRDQVRNTALNQTDLQHTAYWLSDFQKTTTNFAQVKPDSLTTINLMPLRTQNIRNLYIDTCWYDTPWRRLFQDENLNVRIKNTGEQAYQDIPVKLYVDDTLRAISNFNIEAEGETTVKMNYTNQYKGDLLARLQITDYPITYDNKLYFNYKLSDKLNVAFVSDSANAYLSRLFNDSLMNFRHVKPGMLKPNQLNAYHTIFLNELNNIGSGLQVQLLDFIKRGGTIVLIPGIDRQQTDYNQLLGKVNNAPVYQDMRKQELQIKSVNFAHKLYDQAFEKQEEDLNLPRLKRYYPFSLRATSRTNELLSLRNNEPVMLHIPHEKGEVYALGFNLERATTNLMTHPLFVPTFYNIALYSVRQNQLYYTIGGNTQVKLERSTDRSSEVYHIQSLKDNTDFIPRQLTNPQKASVTLAFENQIPEAGYYAVTNQKDTIRYLSFNYNRKESQLHYYSNNEIKDQATRANLEQTAFIDSDPELFSKEVQNISHGSQLWRLFLALALFFLALEAVFTRTLN